MLGIFVKWKRAAVLSEIDASFRLSFLILSTEPEVFDCALFQSALVIKYNLHFYTDGFYRESSTFFPHSFALKLLLMVVKAKDSCYLSSVLQNTTKFMCNHQTQNPPFHLSKNDTPPSSR